MLNPDETRDAAARILRDGRLSEAFVAAWWTGASSYLDDLTPADVSVVDPEWVLDAARDTAMECSRETNAQLRSWA